MRGAAIALIVTLITAAGCTRPIHRRTYVFQLAGHGAYDHPATVPEEAIRLTLLGRVAPVDLDGLPQTMRRAFQRMRPAQVIYYRRPEGGAYLFGVRDGSLVVTPWGRPGRAQRYALTELLRVAPAKAVERGEAAPGATPDQAELEVESAFGVTQYVFVDGTFAGTVPVGASQVFLLAGGRVTIVLADAADGGTNAVRLGLELSPGRRYRLSVLPRL